MSTEIEQLFGGANAEEQNALLHVIKARGYDFLEKTPVTTMTVRLLEDLHKLGYKLVKNNDLLHDVSYSVAQQYAEFCVRCDREKLPLIKIEDYLKQL